jgi:phytoene dehydrogenase-like protein
MGYEEEGIHNKILRYLGINVNIFPLSEAIRITGFSAPLSVFQNRTNHLKQLVQVFPHYKENLSSFYEELWKIARKVRRLIGRVPAMPPKTPQECRYLFSSLGLSDVSLLPLFTKTVADLVKKHGLEDCQSFIHLLDGQIIDSMQTTTEHCSLLMGAFALDVYHEGAFYVEGGVFILARKLQSFIEHHGGEVKLHCKAIHVEKRGALFTVEDEYKQRYKSEHVVSNLPLEKLLGLLEERIVQNLSPKIKEKKDKEQWGVFTMYFALEERVIPSDAPLFQQVLTGKGVAEGEHVFLSLSKKGDTLRAPDGYRTLTCSTHVHLDG